MLCVLLKFSFTIFRVCFAAFKECINLKIKCQSERQQVFIWGHRMAIQGTDSGRNTNCIPITGWRQGFFIRKWREITWIKERNFYWCWHWFCLQLSYWFYFQKDRIFPYGPGVCFPVVLQIIALAQSKSYFASSQTLQRFQEQSVQAVFLQRLLWLYFKTIPLVWTSHRSLHVFVYTFKPC